MNQLSIKMDDKEIWYTQLVLVQEMCALHHFSFEYQIAAPNGITMDTYTEFYKNTLAKPITIALDKEIIFEGMINQITCNHQYEHYLNFTIEGNCTASRLDQVATCQSFQKMNLKDIYTKLIGSTIPSDIQPENSDIIYYTAQYNTTNFGMLQLLAQRYGNWFYNDGKKLIVKKPQQNAVTLDYKASDVNQVKLKVKVPTVIPDINSYDFYNSKDLAAKNKETNNPAELTKIASSKKAKAQHADIFHTTTANQDQTESYQKRKQAQTNQHNIYLSCVTNNTGLRLGSTIELKQKDKSEGKYIITKIIHHSSEQNQYYNELEAYPIENEYPPYVNPDIKIYCPPQYAIVTKNEDSDGLARVKVKFTWQEQSHESPWLNVLVPHAGQDKGIRFLPEQGDEVLVHFLGDNPDHPYVAGAIYTSKNNIGIPEQGNNIKSIRTRSNRRIDFNDEDGLLELTDIPQDKVGNTIKLAKNKQNIKAEIITSDTKKTLLTRQDIDNGITISVEKEDKSILEIHLDLSKEMISIKSNKDIQLTAKSNLKLEAEHISFHADEQLEIKCKSFKCSTEESKIEAQKDIKINSGMNLKLAATNTAVEANAQLELKGAATSKLTGGIVMIN